MQLKQIMRHDHWPVWKLCKSPILIPKSSRVRFVYTCSATKNVTQLLLKADIYRCVSKWRGIPQFMVIPKQWGKWCSPPWNGLGYMYEDIIPICILERYISHYLSINIYIYTCKICVYHVYIYIYTANAWALPRTATTTGNASSSSSPSSSSSSSIECRFKYSLIPLLVFPIECKV